MVEMGDYTLGLGRTFEDNGVELVQLYQSVAYCYGDAVQYDRLDCQNTIFYIIVFDLSSLVQDHTLKSCSVIERIDYLL